MMDIIIGTLIAAGMLLWYSTKTSSDGFQKLWAFLGIMLIALAFLQVSVITPGTRITNVTANSYEWDGYCNVTDLFPVTLSVYPNAVSVEDGTYVSGTLNPGVREIDQDYYIFEENGANFNITWNFTWLSYECPEHMHWTGRYSAPSNREYQWYVYNWTSGAYQATPHDSVPASTIDQSFEYGQACQIDFVESGTHNMMLKMVTSNSASSGEIYTDYMVIDTETDSYAEENRIINCTRTLDESETNYEDSPGGQIVSDGNLALFIVFGMVLFIVMTWFIIDLLGITKDHLGRIVLRKPPE